MNKRSKFLKQLIFAFAITLPVFIFAGCSNDDEVVVNDPIIDNGDASVETGDNFTKTQLTDGTTTFYVIENPNGGATLSFGADSGIGIIEVEVDGNLYAFRDFNGNGILDPWEDWRLDSMERAQSMVDELDIEQISGLMLFGPHEFSIIDGLSGMQRDYIGDSHVRSMLHAADNNVANSVLWNNQIQAFIETHSLENGLMLIPAIIASDPRSTPHGGHTLAMDGSSFMEAGTGKFVSQWPENLGLAALHDVSAVGNAAGMQSEEYRALGIRWALGPQVDLASDPRWGRNWQTFGEDVELSSGLTTAFVDAFQNNGVATTIKHFPADGAGEGGRASTALDGSGAFAVFPGGAQDDHFAVFEAGLNSMAVMTSFAINIDADGNHVWGGDNAWSVAYNQADIDLLRNLGWEGVVVTDWFVPADPDRSLLPDGRRWGMEQEDWAGIAAQEYYRILSAGVDVFGGMNNLQNVLDAYDAWQTAYETGEETINADARWRQTGVRVLNLMFSVDTFDNPFVDLDDSLATVGSQTKVEAGIQAQLNSVVMLKNDGVIDANDLGDLAGLTVYVPATFSVSSNWQTGEVTVNSGASLSEAVLDRFVGDVITDEVVLTAEGDDVEEFVMPDLDSVDLIIIGMGTPEGGGFDAGTGEFTPRTLQWRPYTADGPDVRRVSIGGLILEDGTRENRSYFGRTTTASNEGELDMFERVVAAVAASGRDIPIIVVLQASSGSTFVPTEIYGDASAILIGYQVAEEALIQVALGLHNPNGRLPIGMPASMEVVEASYEDLAKDHAPFVDTNGNEWRFGFGLNWNGPIN